MSQGDVLALPPPTVTVVTGSTASGKSGLALQLAQHWQGQGYQPVILCADSQQVIEGMAIGTAQPSVAEQALVPHVGLGWATPDQPFSVADFVAKAHPCLCELTANPQTPVLVVGGTGFYLQALFEPTVLPAVAPNPALRQQLQAQAASQPAGWLHQQLTLADPARASQLHPNDTFRVLRALEIIAAQGGQPVPTQTSPALWPVTAPNVVSLALSPPSREWLWQRIEQRVDAMLAQGWLAETEALVVRYGAEAHALQVAHGYPELVAVLQGRTSLPEARQRIIFNVRQYARRQRIWLARRSQWMHTLPATASVAEALAVVCG
jgi:tRNA dimethylallyltransferase